MKDWFEKPAPGVEHGYCDLRIDGPSVARNPGEAWALLPRTGEGWVVLTDGVRRFETGSREGLLLHAEVVLEATTVVVRHDEGVWRAWTWTENRGDSHRVVRRRYLSSAPKVSNRVPEMEYATYWEKRQDDGLAVWRPLGSRFVGWR